MSAQTEDQEIVEMMARNRRGKMLYGVIAIAALILTAIAAMSYFASIAANAP